MLILYIVTGVALVGSLLADRRRTVRALRIALKRFAKIAPSFVVMLVLVAIVLRLVPSAALARVLAREGKWLGMAGAVGVGSISAMPGFIAFPLCGILLDRGASYAVLSAFSTSLMMVGVVTFPLERTYLGTRLALVRNVVGLLIAILVAVATGLVFGGTAVNPFKQHPWATAITSLFAVFVFGSLAAGYAPGREMGTSFLQFSWRMFRILPSVFILIGLFDVWVKHETVQRHLGHGSGPLAYTWAILLASTAVGGLHVALPIAHALHVKRAKLSVVLTFVSAAAVCRIPMTLFEASFLGWRFTMVRLFLSVPLVILSSIAIGNWLERRHYSLP